MLREKFTLRNTIYFLVFLVVFGYLLSICFVNLTGRVWCNYDIYSDAVLAKYMWEAKTLFPRGWHFGNQIYVTATPAVAALFYGVTKDAYLALAFASCFMTLGILFSYIWCVKPFVHVKSILVSLLVVIGGTNIGSTAHGDWLGFQVFYTMASYYACYVIGIFLTLGVYFRLVNQKRVPMLIQLGVLFYNLALGMQSLREMLVLNLPLCAIVILHILLHHKDLRRYLQEKRDSIMFAFLALVCNSCGVLLTKIFIQNGTVKQSTIISGVSPNIRENYEVTVNAIRDYIGLCTPTTFFEWLKHIGGIFSIGIVLLSLLCIFIGYRKDKKIVTMGYIVLFFVISLLAVFCAGLFIISVRDIYFFCWYFLVASSVAMLMEERWGVLLKGVLIVGLIGISVLNYDFTFGQSYRWLSGANNLYQGIVGQLQELGITYLYSDWRTERNKISAMSFDEIQYATLQFSGNPEDLWLKTEALYHDEWFETEHFEHSYIILSDYALYCLEVEFSEEYRRAFLENLVYVYSVDAEGEKLHFFLGSDKMYGDMMK